MIDDLKPPLDEALLAHFGVKGMHWGIRNEQGSSGGISTAQKQSRFSPEQKARAKKVAIGAGILAVAAGTAYVAYRMNKSGNLPVSSLKSPSASAKKLVNEVKEQTDLIHATRGKHKGFQFLNKGGLHDPLQDYEMAFGADSGKAEVFRRLNDGRIAAGFLDIEGRSDRAGRTIPHQVLIPKSMTSGIENLDDVKRKIWPILKDAYDEMYPKPIDNSYS